MSVLTFLIAWPNAPFTIVGGIAILFALLNATGMMGLVFGGDHDGESDGDGHALDGHGDGDSDADHDVDHDVEHGTGGERSLGAAFFESLGFGKLPLSLIWQVFAITFAVVGLILNARYFANPATPEAPPLVSLAWTIPCGILAGYGAVALMARTLGPIFTSKAQEATSRSELVGKMGVVISSRITEEFGEIRIRDKSGHDLRVLCKLASGQVPIPEKANVVVIDYDEEKSQLLVAPFDEELESRERERRS